MSRKTNIPNLTPSIANTRFWMMFSLVAVILLSGCTATRFLKEGESFYGGAVIRVKPNGKIPSKGKLKTELTTLVTPKPNKKFL